MTQISERVKVEVDASSIVNRMTNHSANLNTTAGWDADQPSAGPQASVNTGSHPAGATGRTTGVIYAGRSVRLDYTAVPDTTIMDYHWFRVAPDATPTPGQWIGAQMTLALPEAPLPGQEAYENNLWCEVEWRFWKAGEAPSTHQASWYYGKTSTKITGAGAVVPRGQAFVMFHTALVPAGCNAARFYVRVYRGNGSSGHQGYHGYVYAGRVMMVTGATQGEVTGVAFSDTGVAWLDVIGDSTTLRISRGMSLDGVTERLETGRATVVVHDAALDPAGNPNLRPGRAVQITCETSSEYGFQAGRQAVFVGKLATLDTAYRLSYRHKRLQLERTITLTAVDAGAEVLAVPRAYGVDGSVRARVTNAIGDSLVPLGINDTDPSTSVDTGTISYLQDGTIADQLALIRNSIEGTQIYVDRDGSVRAVAPANVVTTTKHTYTDTAAVAGIEYRDVEAAFGSDAHVNTVMVRKLGVTLDNGEKLFGPYQRAASVASWGRSTAELVINDGTSRAAAVAKLQVFSTPKLYVRSITFDLPGDTLSPAYLLELYQVVRVVLSSAGIDTTYRVLGIEHEVTPLDYKPGSGGRWTVTVRLLPLRETETITVDNPSTGAETGPEETYTPTAVHHMVRSGGVQSVPNAVLTGAVWGSVQAGSRGITYSAGVATVSKTGLYSIVVSAGFAPHATGRREANTLVNGAVVRTNMQRSSGAAERTDLNSTSQRRLNAGDQISVQLFQDSGAALNTAGGATVNRLEIVRVGD